MTNTNIYFIANWKMFGDLTSINTINNVIKLSKNKKFKKAKIVYCPPYTLLNEFFKKIKNTNISIGAQDCHEVQEFGAFTGGISASQLKQVGVNYVILGHSERRAAGDTNKKINKKIISALKKKLNIILCVGENLKERKKGISFNVVKKQLDNCLKQVKNLKPVLIAYEPIWSIGTGKILNISDLNLIIKQIRIYLNKKSKNKNIKILYGGSVNPKNILDLKKVSNINGFLIGNSSQKQNIFVDIIKKSII
tara:strand:- start:14232 stop:14984 length:753 start_codon:yes stop_codon:yes gene_type:complete